jgi:predicted O-methyltransferase YrrM
MSDQRWADVDEYLTGLFGGEDEVLTGAVAAGEAAGLPDIQVSPEQGRLLQVLARTVNARSILEIGTLAGYSTIWLARSLPEDGRLISLEYEPKHAEVARANLERAGLSEIAEVRVGPASESLAALAADNAGPYDLVFIDADKSGYPDYLAWSLKLTRPGSLIVADNVVRQGKLADPANQESAVVGVRRYIELVAAEPRLTAGVVQTVGIKGYDGLCIAVVGEG